MSTPKLSAVGAKYSKVLLPFSPERSSVTTDDTADLVGLKKSLVLLLRGLERNQRMRHLSFVLHPQTFLPKSKWILQLVYLCNIIVIF